MFDIGFFELMLVGIVALVILGPERLPTAARTAGLWIGRIKRSVANMQRDITAQLEAEELRQKLAEQQKKLDESLKSTTEQLESSFQSEKPKSAQPVETASANLANESSAEAHEKDTAER